MEISHDSAKNERNIAERRLPFERAADFDFETAKIWQDLRKPYPESRFVAIGYLDDRLHVLVFCEAESDPIIDSATEILGLQMNSSFPGTLTQAATLIVRDRGWLQRAGAFVGATQNITITHPMRVLGGTFQSTAGELRLGSALTSRTLMEFAPGASFAHNNGVVYFNGRQPGCVPNQSLTLDLSPSITLYNATFYGDNNSSCGYSGYAVAAGDTLVVQNELRLNCGRLDGNYELRGDLIIAGGFGGNGTITVNGSGEQTYRWNASPVMSRAPNITIDKSSGSFRPFLGNNTLHRRDASYC